MLSKEAIEYLMQQGINPQNRVVDIKDSQGEDRTFFVKDNGQPVEIEEMNIFSVHPFHVKTLTGLVEYIKDNESRPIEEGYLHVEDERTVSLFSKLDQRGNREHLISAFAIVPHFEFGHFNDAEELIICLQSMFTKTKDRDLLLQVIGNVKEENVRNTGDNGFSQAVTVKTGVASADDVKVPNPVTLAPYRTFLEVEQPESEFIFRMKDGPRGAIFEADGGAWRNEAITNVRDYLADALKDEMESGRITIIA